MRRVCFLIVALAVSAAGCSSFETIPLADDGPLVSNVPLPVPAPRASLAAASSASVVPPEVKEPAAEEPPLPRPAARPTAVRGWLDAPGPAAATAVSAVTQRLHQIGEMAIGTANAAEAESDPAARFQEASFHPSDAKAVTPEAQPAVDPDAIERRDVKAVKGCVNDVFRTCPLTAGNEDGYLRRTALSARSDEAPATLGLAGAPALDVRTALWVMIGFAALLGLFLSARRRAD